MKNIILILLMILFLSCEKDESHFEYEKYSIIGEWEVEYYSINDSNILNYDPQVYYRTCSWIYSPTGLGYFLLNSSKDIKVIFDIDGTFAWEEYYFSEGTGENTCEYHFCSPCYIEKSDTLNLFGKYELFYDEKLLKLENVIDTSTFWDILKLNDSILRISTDEILYLDSINNYTTEIWMKKVLK